METESQKLVKCCYCKYWKLLTEDGETGWCKIHYTWKNWDSVCDKWNKSPTVISFYVKEYDME